MTFLGILTLLRRVLHYASVKSPFNRIPVRRNSSLSVRAARSSSNIFLRRIPTSARAALVPYSQETLSIFKDYSTIPTVTRSPFAALSSFTDNFQSIEDLGPVQEGVFIEESSIPYIPILPHDNDTKFNAHLYDSCKHGSWEVLVRDNGIKQCDRVIGAKDDLDLDNPEEKDSDADVPEVSSGGIEVQKPMETLENIIKTVVKGKGKFKVADS
ncbi:hypothetical protein Forpe1208_v007633 [Fusarium oxysporum f. sp. rapae]|uniref:Uncharacterized protein n=1 Tax=Fusarium oxysporum f. sp. rapae TaxID=485398 RepID=A0A8J5P8S1_FUSOX|nr:hypothetical protein Forpe1208_v007633 [Fusarium oxysporum f. sp. rapae]